MTGKSVDSPPGNRGLRRSGGGCSSVSEGGRRRPGSQHREDEAGRVFKTAPSAALLPWRQEAPSASEHTLERASPTPRERQRPPTFSPPSRSGGGCPSVSEGGRGRPGSQHREDEAGRRVPERQRVREGTVWKPESRKRSPQRAFSRSYPISSITSVSSGGVGGRRRAAAVRMS